MSIDDGALDIFPEVDGVELIQRTPLFAKLGFEETHRLAEITRVEKFPRGRKVLEQDALGNALYIIRSGSVVIRRRDSRGQNDVVGQLATGEIFGEMSLIDDQLVSADVEVVSEELEVLVVPRDAFEQLIAGNDRLASKVYRAFCRTLSDRLRRLNQRFAELHDEK